MALCRTQYEMGCNVRCGGVMHNLASVWCDMKCQWHCQSGITCCERRRCQRYGTCDIAKNDGVV